MAGDAARVAIECSGRPPRYKAETSDDHIAYEKRIISAMKENRFYG